MILWSPPSVHAYGAGVGNCQSENILVLVADDLGVDRVGAYTYTNNQGQTIAPATTNIDQLAAEGVLFRRAWAAPGCSASRGSSLTGRYPNRLGVGSAIGSNGSGDTGLRDDFVTIGDSIPSTYTRVILSKWHLAGSGPLGALAQGLDHAPRCGFDVHLGTFGNLGGQTTYFDWNLLLSLASSLSATTETAITGTYATTYSTDSALRAIRALGDSPWFIWVGFHAPHPPYHIPPAHLIQTPGLDTTQNIGKGKAMVEALDTEIGRLLAGISPDVRSRTTIIFYGDNGTHAHLVQPPFSGGHSKGTVYNGGVHVPMIVSSPRTPAALYGSECNALVDVTDLLPTIVELSGGAPVPGLDGTSMVPYLNDPSTPSQRDWIYAEKFKPNFVPIPGQTIGSFPLTKYHQAVRGPRFKLMRETESLGTVLQMFDMRSDYFESQNLLSAEGNPPAALQAEFDSLLAVLDRMAL